MRLCKVDLGLLTLECDNALGEKALGDAFFTVFVVFVF